MIYIIYLRDVVVCFFASFFYGKIMSTPAKPLIPASISAALMYLVYRIIYLQTGHELLGYLSAAAGVSLVAEILARKYKTPATIFVMPGIIPLVPGVGLYRSMLLLVRNDINGALNAGVKTLFISGIIAVSIAIVNAIARNVFRAPKGTNK